MAEIISSSRNFFPGGALESSKNLWQKAQEAGYQGIEFLPSWAVCWESISGGDLSIYPEFVSSLHRDWRLDRVMEARVKGKPDICYQLRNKEDWLFPPSDVCLGVLQKLQKKYKVSVSTMWFSDVKNFSPVMLELWSTEQGVNQNSLLTWLRKDPKNHGVVIDTAKIDSWAETNGISVEYSLRKLWPYISEVHYRFKGKSLGRISGVRGNLSEDSNKNMETILRMGYRGRIVVESGWPDMEKGFSVQKHREILNILHGF